MNSRPFVRRLCSVGSAVGIRDQIVIKAWAPISAGPVAFVTSATLLIRHWLYLACHKVRYSASSSVCLGQSPAVVFISLRMTVYCTVLSRLLRIVLSFKFRGMGKKVVVVHVFHIDKCKSITRKNKPFQNIYLSCKTRIWRR